MVFVAVLSGNTAKCTAIKDDRLSPTIKKLLATGIFIASFFEEAIDTEHHRAIK
jgi:hypothetical protein